MSIAGTGSLSRMWVIADLNISCVVALGTVAGLKGRHVAHLRDRLRNLAGSGVALLHTGHCMARRDDTASVMRQCVLAWWRKMGFLPSMQPSMGVDHPLDPHLGPRIEIHEHRRVL